MIATSVAPIAHEPELVGQTVVLIGGSAGIGLETARHARAEGDQVILVARRPEPLEKAAREVGALSSAAFEQRSDRARRILREPLAADRSRSRHRRRPDLRSALEMEAAEVRDAISGHAVLALEVARHAVGKMRPGGTLVFMGGDRRTACSARYRAVSAATNATPELIAALALEVAPVRANLIAAGFVDTLLSASILGDQLDARREQLRTTLPIGRVVGPADVAALAVHIMVNTALTGATFDIDGGQQFVE